MHTSIIHLVGPGGAGKTTTGAALARRLRFAFVDLDERFAALVGDVTDYIDTCGYGSYATRNVQTYLEVVAAAAEPRVLALSSGFMTYPIDTHPDYARIRQTIATSPSTFVLLPSLDCNTCVAEIVRRQLRRPFARSAEREAAVIQQRFGVYRDLPAMTLETMQPVSSIVDAAVRRLHPEELFHRRRSRGGDRGR